MNASGHFRDLFYVVTVTAVTALSDWIDTQGDRLAPLTDGGHASSIALFVVYMIVVMYATAHFVLMSGAAEVLSASELDNEYFVVTGVLAMTLATEVVIAFAHSPHAPKISPARAA